LYALAFEATVIAAAIAATTETAPLVPVTLPMVSS
jgi:hypothetical protein